MTWHFADVLLARLSPAMTGAAIAAATTMAARMPRTFLFKRSSLEVNGLLVRFDRCHDVVTPGT
jgi:hypothetical protein